MPVEGVVLLTAAGAAAAFLAPVRVGLPVLVGSWLLVPQVLRLPWSAHLGVGRVVAAALVAGLVARCARGDLPASRNPFVPTTVHVAFAAYLAVAAVSGVALADPAIPAEQSVFAWSRIADQALFFVAILALARIAGPRRVATAVAVGAAAAAAVALAERLSDLNWLAWWLEDVPEQAPALALRGGETRVRAAAEFALEFAWVSAVLLPLTLAVAVWARRRVALVLPAAVLVASVWSVSRSALGGLALGVLILVVAAPRDRRLRTAGAVGALALGALLLLPQVRDPFFAAFQTEEAAIRVERLPGILAEAADDPVSGLGLGGLAVRGFPTTDISYVLTYGELGVVGLVALLALWATAVAAVAAGLGSRDARGRAVAAGAVAGALLVPIAAGAYDLSSTAQSTKALWALVAIGIATAERAPSSARRIRLPALPLTVRVGLPLAGAVAGLALVAAVPERPVQAHVFEALHPREDLEVPHRNAFAGRVLVATACGLARAVEVPPGTRVRCRLLDAAGGIGELRVSAPDRARLDAAQSRIFRSVGDALPGFVLHPRGPAAPARPSGVETAPVWMAAAGGAVAVVWPRRQPAKRSPTTRNRDPATAPTNAPAAWASAPAAPDS